MLASRSTTKLDKTAFFWLCFSPSTSYFYLYSHAVVNYWLFVLNVNLNYDWRYKNLPLEFVFMLNLKLTKAWVGFFSCSPRGLKRTHQKKVWLMWDLSIKHNPQLHIKSHFKLTNTTIPKVNGTHSSLKAHSFILNSYIYQLTLCSLGQLQV